MLPDHEPHQPHEPRDLELISQRILKLAEIATLEHLQQILNSQAQGVLELQHEIENAA